MIQTRRQTDRLGLAVGAAAVVAVTVWRGVNPRPSSGPASLPKSTSQNSSPPAEAADPALSPEVTRWETPDEQTRRRIQGVWMDNYQGKRTMTLQPDGVGTIVVELQGVTATLFASRLRFDIRWRIEDERLHKRVLGGEPSARVNMILKTMGDRTDEKILELTDERLLLLDKDGKTQYDFRREAETDLRPKGQRREGLLLWTRDTSSTRRTTQ